jgi:hypothetical protein
VGYPYTPISRKISEISYLRNFSSQDIGNTATYEYVIEPQALTWRTVYRELPYALGWRVCAQRAENRGIILPRFRVLSIQEQRPGMVPARLTLLKNEVLSYFPGSGRGEARTLFGMGSRACNGICAKQISTGKLSEVRVANVGLVANACRAYGAQRSTYTLSPAHRFNQHSCKLVLYFVSRALRAKIEVMGPSMAT